MQLHIGSYQYSSWSLRGWLAMKLTSAKFEVIETTLKQPDTQSKILKFSPSGKVPALIVNNTVISDSLAIMEYANELSNNELLPKDSLTRAYARSIIAEMHGGFSAIRQQLSFDCKLQSTKPYLADEAVTTEINRINQIWSHCLDTYHGTYLFGDQLSLADIAYAPVACRFQQYNVQSLSKNSLDYVAAITKHELIRKWYSGNLN